MKKKKSDQSSPTYTQLVLFPPSPNEILCDKMAELEQKLDRQRKSQFAKIGELQKKYDMLYEDMEILKRGICQSKQSCEILEMGVV